MTGWSDNPIVIGIRSLLFHILSILTSLVLSPLMVFVFAPRALAWKVARRYVAIQIWLLKTVCGLGYRVVGAEHLPNGPCILASRHEAMWETLFLPLVFNNPGVLLKEEILRYPLAGAVARSLDYIGIDRGGSPDKAKEAFDLAKEQAKEGRSLLIFPSGTRNPQHKYRVQKGVAVLYRVLKLPCVPIVLDSGDYWLYRRWLRRPGTITVRILPPISTGLRTGEFLTQLEQELSKPAA